MSKEPRLTDFYDESDPRGCSSSEYEAYKSAHKKWEEKCDDFVLGFCTNCFQMTNHLHGVCQKCKPKLDNVGEGVKFESSKTIKLGNNEIY